MIPDSMLYWPGFTLWRKDRYDKSDNTMNVRRGGEILIYISDKYSKYIKQPEFLTLINNDIEMMTLTMQYPYTRRMQLTLVYRPPTGSHIKFVDSIRNVLCDLNLLKVDVVILGDYNINYNQRNSKGFKLLKSFERESGLKQLVTADTRICRQYSSRIDLILSNMKDINAVSVLDVLISDHFPITLVKKHRSVKTESKWITGRQYKKYDFKLFRTLLESRNWTQYFLETDPNVLWNDMKTALDDSLKIMCPIKTFKVHIQTSDWITADIRKNILLKKKLLKQSRKTKLDEDWLLFREQRRKTSNLIRKSKSELVKDKLHYYSNNPKKFWEVINESFGNLKDKVQQDTILISEDSNCEIPVESGANYMNTFFCSIGSNKLCDKEILDRYSVYNSNDVDYNSMCMEFEFIEVNWKCVKKVVNDIDIHKSSSVEHLNSKILKDAFIVLILQLTHLFNCSLGTNLFPDEWKLGKIIPIPKTKERHYVTNWRPISLLALPGKLLEKLVHKQLFAHLKYNKLLSDKQHGFTSGRSTSTAIQDFMLFVCNNINKTHLCSGTFIDLSKAFDSLNHKLLLHKLKDYGILGKLAPWFESYLSNRCQKTLFNNIESNYMPVTHRVPQCSTLGPLLYILYVNDCFEKVVQESSSTIMYADNTVLLSNGENQDEAVLTNQLSFDRYIDWAENNCLSINVRKTKQMILCPRSKNRTIDDLLVIRKDQDIVCNTSYYTYLGVDVDQNLCFENFLKSIIQKVNYKLYLFSKIRYVLTHSAAVLVYKQMVLPFFDYMDILIDSGSKKYIEKLQKLQFRGIKIIYQYCFQGHKIIRMMKKIFI